MFILKILQKFFMRENASVFSIGPIDQPSHSASLELHDVLGQGARLVREDILDLSQLVVQIRGTGVGRRVGLFMEHVNILEHSTQLPKNNFAKVKQLYKGQNQ